MNAPALRYVVSADDRATGVFRNMRQELTTVAKQTEALRQGLSRIGGVGLVGGGLVGLGIAAKQVAGDLFQASVNAQRLVTQLNYATGGGAGRELAFVSGVVDRLGLDLDSTARAYASFASAARGTALEGQGAQRVFEAIAKASAVMGLSADENRGVLQALSQMISKGVVSAEELRGQLGERLPGAFQIAARSMGVTTQELGKMLEQGQLLAADFLPRFAKQLESELGGAAEAAANRLEASVNRMGNAWERLKKNLGNAGPSQGLAAGASGIANDLQAISEAMEIAERGGGGALRRWNDGLGMFLGRAIGLQNINRDFMTLKGAAEDARATIARIDEQERREGKLSIYSMDERARAMRDLARASRELAAASPNTGSGSVPNPDRLLARAQDADLQRRQGLAAELMKTLATPQEQLDAELKRQRGQLGDQFTPELEKRLRDKYIKPEKKTKDKAPWTVEGWLGEVSQTMDRSFIELNARGAEEQRRNSEQRVTEMQDMLDELVDANARASASLIADERTRGQALIALDTQVQLRKLEALEVYGEAYTRAREQILAGEQLRLRQLDQDLDKVKETGRSVGQELALVFESAAGKAITQWQGVGNLLKGILQDIAQIALRETVTKPISKAVGGALGGGSIGDWVNSLNLGKFLGISFGMGGAFDGNVRKFAAGDVFGSPTLFRYGGGRTGMMGEAGPEAIMPLKRGSDGKLGVASGGDTYVFNVAAGATVDEWRRSQRAVAAEHGRRQRRAGGLA